MRRVVGVLLGILVFVSCDDLIEPEGEPVEEPSFALVEEAQQGFVPPPGTDRYIVRYWKSTPNYQSKRAELLQKHKGMFEFEYERLLGGKAFVGWFTPQEAKKVEADPNVRSASQDRPLPLVSTRTVSGPGDWGMDRMDQRQGRDSLFHYYGNGDGVHVFIVDTGVDTTVAQFSGRIGQGWAKMNLSPQDPVSAYADTVGHGTKMASAALGADFGVATGATLHPIKISNAGPAQTADMILGIEQAVLMHNSYSFSNSVLNLSYQFDDGDVKDAVNEAYDEGILVVKGGGNDNDDSCDYNGNSAYGTIAVGAIDDDDDRWVISPDSGSVYGNCVDLFSPGWGVTVVTTGSDSVYATGTSVAAAFVTGVAAIILEENPTLQPGDLKQILKGSATLGELGNLNGSPNRLLFSLYLWTDHINGGDVGYEGNHTFSVDDPVGGSGSYTYLWEYSENETSWTSVGTSQSYIRYVEEDDPNFFLRATVSSAGVSYTTRVEPIYCCWNEGECEVPENN